MAVPTYVANLAMTITKTIGAYTRIVLLAACLLIMIGATALAATPAQGYVFWSTGAELGRMDLDGDNQITGLGGEIASNPGFGQTGVATDGSYLYWIDPYAIGRMTLDGSQVEANFIVPQGWDGNGYFEPDDLAISQGHLYWTWTDTNDPDPDSVARANLDGTGVNEHLIDLPGGEAPLRASGIAADGNYLYYRVDDSCSGDSCARSGWIERARLDGSGVTPHFIDLPDSDLYGRHAIAAGGGYIFWDGGSAGIGRANADGSAVRSGLIPHETAQQSDGMAVYNQNLYWASDGEEAYDDGVARSGLDGSGMDTLVTAPSSPGPITVGPDATATQHKRSLSLKYKSGAFHGKLKSDAAECMQNQRVLVYKKRHGKGRKLGSDRTNNAGKYKVSQKQAEGRFYAEVKPRTTCQAAKSRTKRFG